MARGGQRISRAAAKMAPVTVALLTDLWDKVPAGMAGAGDSQVLRIVEAELAALCSVTQAARGEVASWRRLYGEDNLDGAHPMVRAVIRHDRARKEGR